MSKEADCRLEPGPHYLPGLCLFTPVLDSNSNACSSLTSDWSHLHTKWSSLFFLVPHASLILHGINM